jgi:hypothetical protein
MVFRGATSLRGALEGVGPENRDFFGPWNGTSGWALKIETFLGPEMATSEARAICAQKSQNSPLRNITLHA